MVYIGEKGGKFSNIASESQLFDELHYISAGKLRRYHGESWLVRLTDIKTALLNIRDFFSLTAGLMQSYLLLRKLKPAAIFLKGGFVCVPVALAAHKHGVPYITHDSDALPGLSNRIAARWAKYHATAWPAKYYSYPDNSIKVVGVPSDDRFRIYSASERSLTRQKYNIPPESPVLLITGGSNGARRLNTAALQSVGELLSANPDLYILHQLGANNSDQLTEFKDLDKLKDRIHFFDFSSELFLMSDLADVVVTRAGASIMADLANQNKACVVIPNPYLTGGHQLKNARVYEDAGAALILKESDLLRDPTLLPSAVQELIDHPEQRKVLAANLYKLVPDNNAAAAIANLLIEIAR